MMNHYLSPLGWVEYRLNKGFLVHMSFCDEPINQNIQPDIVFDALERYFKFGDPLSDVPIRFEKGTPFQLLVWNALSEIPYGKTWSYQELAIHINRPKAVRAVGQACKRNPIGIIVPCHRVIGKDGALTGYSGKGYIDLKSQLLKHEKRIFKPR